MELNLSRVDYLHGGSSFPNCIKILPTFQDDKSQHKLVVASRDGIVQILGWGRTEAIIACKFVINGPISSICLGGAIGMMQLEWI